ncbi:uncharacterized protein C9orf43 homolog [Ambystoma mexicanum]|uniref:uncharacterized protein C9orf43 homolog n=1 Tax=Ambystoma mexicanum TaxID=8296 RepID=UPI0037E87370
MIADSRMLDETVCTMPVCQHPLCWTSVRRLVRGRPRYQQRKLGTSFGSTSEDEDELPTMKIITLPSFYPQTTEGSMQYRSLSRSCATQTEQEHVYDPFSYEASLHSFSHKSANFSFAKLYFPGLNSTKDFQNARNLKCVPQGKVQKLDVIDLDDCALSSHRNGSKVKQPSVVWVPQSQQLRQRQRIQEGSGTQETFRICIKDLTAEIPRASADVGRSAAHRTKRKKCNKVPTGGQPYSLPTVIQYSQHSYTRSLPGNLPINEIKANAKQSFSAEGGSPEDPLQQRANTTRQTCIIAPELQDLRSPLLDNKKMILHEMKERRSHSGPVQNGSPRYKLDEKPLGFQKGTEVDLESIKNQPYLWKKYMDGVGRSGKMRVTGHCPNKVQHFDGSFGFIGGLGLFPSPGETSRLCQKNQPEEPIDDSISCKEEELSQDDRAASSGLATISGESRPVHAPEAGPLLNKQLSLTTAMLSEFSEEESHAEGTHEALDLKDSGKSATDANRREETKSHAQMTETWNEDNDSPSKEPQKGEYPGALAEVSDSVANIKEKAPEEGEKGESSTPRPPPPPPSPLIMSKTIVPEGGNQAVLEPTTFSL